MLYYYSYVARSPNCHIIHLLPDNLVTRQVSKEEEEGSNEEEGSGGKTCGGGGK